MKKQRGPEKKAKEKRTWSERIGRAVLLGPLLLKMSPLERRAILSGLDLTSDDLRIGVDGGTDVWLKAGLSPHLAVGDWDSLRSRNVLQTIPHLTYSREKDESDLFLAARAAIDLGARSIICAGVTGGRLDHHLASIYDLSRIAGGKLGKVRAVSAIGPEGATYFLSGKIPVWKEKLRSGQAISVLAVGGSAQGVSLQGFKHSLRNATLACSSLGLSNRVKAASVKVELKRGSLIVFVPSAENG
jgi:thiamine pyrophosphokinase